MDEWYFSNNGNQEGPVTAPQLQGLLRAGVLNAEQILVWKEGMTEWSSLQDAGLLVATTPVVAAGPSSQLTPNPYLLSERSQQALAFDNDSYAPSYEGDGRLKYFLVSMGVSAVCYGVLFAVMFAIVKTTESYGAAIGVFVILSILFMIATLYVGAQRTKNLGMSGAAILWTFVPIMNLWIGWRMIACPEGYEDNRSLDVPGKVISGLWIGMIVLAIGSSFINA
jgi:uncharacterized membrane protein YhaH (DUF805 family)